MKASCQSLPYQQTGYFSKLVLDYLQQDAALQPFYRHAPNLQGIQAAIAQRQQFPQNRALLAEALQEQYEGIEAGDAVNNNMAALLQPNTFTITTAHQPNIFTGPLYFIYKILHAIKLAAHLQEQMPQHRFVPVYYMGSEDADLDELGHIYIDGEKIAWNTSQSGAVGRMNTKGLEQITQRLQGQFGHLPFGEEMVVLCTQAYTKHRNVQQATLWLVNELFKDYGLIVVVPDNAKLKSAFNAVIEKELLERFSAPLVHQTASAIAEKYKVQTQGRDINLFYLSDNGSRDRIEYSHEGGEERWSVVNTELVFLKNALLEELQQHPERFSANVILRGVFQETILPNIAFIGGGGELAYWMELQKVFEAVQVPYPVLLLRNSFLLVNQKQQALQQKLGLTVAELFLTQEELLNNYTLAQAKVSLETTAEQAAINAVYEQLQNTASQIDITLKPHIAALQVGSLKGLINLEKKLLRAEKRKHAEYGSHVQRLKSVLFPHNNLQERIDNFLPLYAQHGKALIQVLYENSEAFASGFTVLSI